jgi:hypothetical protein
VLKYFTYSWLTYWIIIALLPVHSVYLATIAAFGVQLLFVALVMIGYSLVTSIFGVHTVPPARQHEIVAARSLIQLAIALSIVGLLAIIYDKVYVQGIDYSEGIALAREEWRRLGEEREGRPSSIYSICGYLFGSAYFVAVVLAITQVRVLSAGERLLTLVVSFALLIANSALVGGRSSVLLLTAFVFGALSARRGLSLRELLPAASQRLLLSILAFAGGAYTVFVFYQRAQAGDVPALQYALDFLPFLGVEVDDWYRNLLDDGALSSFSAMCVLALSYLTHSFASVAAIVDSPTEHKTIVFLGMHQLLQNLGLASEPDFDWLLVGRFPSVPGAYLHQFGWFGFTVASCLTGMISGATTVWTTRAPHRVLPLGAYVMAATTLVLTPQLFAPDFLSFPFVAASFFMIAAAERLIRREQVVPT